jgi:hypothetical protein
MIHQTARILDGHRWLRSSFGQKCLIFFFRTNHNIKQELKHFSVSQQHAFFYLNNMILVFIHRLLLSLTMATVPDARIFMCLTVNNPGNQSHHVPPKYSHAIPRLLSLVFSLLLQQTERTYHLSECCHFVLLVIYAIFNCFFCLSAHPTDNTETIAPVANQVTANSHQQCDAYGIA